MFDWRGLTAAIAGDGGLGLLGMCGYARRKEKGKASQLVVAFGPNGHGSGSGDQSLRQSMAVIFEIKPRTTK
jgi:hypothetical protein